MARQTTKLVALSVVFGLLLAMALFFFLLSDPSRVPDRSAGRSTEGRALRVLAYSSFVSSWGPGPEIAALFEKRTGLVVELRDAEDAGLLLKKLELFPSDVVVGFDQLLLPQARRTRKWKPLPSEGVRFAQEGFLPFDWGPLAFVYRDGEIEPPKSLDDLLDPRFHRTLALQDPRTSSPGLQFLFWVLEQKGIEGGFDFLARLKPSIHTVGGSWSTAYGVFQDGQAKLALSYLTSPVYHWTNENDHRYRAAIFSEGHPVQVEYAAVPETCIACEAAIEFVRFLLEPEAQTILMQKNFMLPVVDSVRKGTPFETLPEAKILPIQSIEALSRDRERWLTRWRELGL